MLWKGQKQDQDNIKIVRLLLIQRVILTILWKEKITRLKQVRRGGSRLTIKVEMAYKMAITIAIRRLGRIKSPMSTATTPTISTARILTEIGHRCMEQAE